MSRRVRGAPRAIQPGDARRGAAREHDQAERAGDVHQHERLATDGEDDRGEGQESGQKSMSRHPDDCIVSVSVTPTSLGGGLPRRRDKSLRSCGSRTRRRRGDHDRLPHRSCRRRPGDPRDPRRRGVGREGRRACSARPPRRAPSSQCCRRRSSRSTRRTRGLPPPPGWTAPPGSTSSGSGCGPAPSTCPARSSTS